eukprot:gene5242-6523_t
MSNQTPLKREHNQNGDDKDKKRLKLSPPPQHQPPMMMGFQTGKGTAIQLTEKQLRDAQAKIDKMQSTFNIDEMIPDTNDDTEFQFVQPHTQQLSLTPKLGKTPIKKPAFVYNTTGTPSTTPSTYKSFVSPSNSNISQSLGNNNNEDKPTLSLNSPATLKNQQKRQPFKVPTKSSVNTANNNNNLQPDQPQSQPQQQLQLQKPTLHTNKSPTSGLSLNQPKLNHNSNGRSNLGIGSKSPTSTTPKNLPPPVQTSPLFLPQQQQQQQPQLLALPPAQKPSEKKKTLKDYFGTPFSTSPIGIIKKEILEINRHNAQDFKFENCNDYKEYGIKSKQIGVLEIYVYFLSKEKLDSSLLTEEWLRNHYGWIVWKLAAMERSFPKELGGKHCVLNRVIDQLRYRFETEIVQCKRPILRKIYERDDTSQRHMILCVSDIIDDDTGLEQQNNNNNIVNGDDELTEATTTTTTTEEEGEKKSNVKKSQSIGIIELTDGWYPIRAHLDPHLTYCLQQKKIFVGQKLRIQSAQIFGKESGISPWEEERDQVHLKLFANSTRIAKWYEKLGLQRQPCFPVTLKSIVPGGGPVACVHIEVLRIYPITYQETIEKGSVKYTLRLNESEENKKQTEFHSLKSDIIESKIEEIRERIEREQEKQQKSKINNRYKNYNMANIRVPSLIYDLFITAIDPDEVYKLLDDDQKSLLEIERNNRSQLLEQQVMNELKSIIDSNPNLQPRKVKNMLTIKIRDLLSSGGSPTSSTIVNSTLPPQPSIKSFNPQHQYMNAEDLFNSVDEVPIFTSKSTKEEIEQFKNSNQFIYDPSLSSTSISTVNDQSHPNGNDNNNNTMEIQYDEHSETLLTINTPQEELLETLKETLKFKIYSLTPKPSGQNQPQKRKSHSNPISHLQSTTRTQFTEIIEKSKSLALISGATNNERKVNPISYFSGLNEKIECDLVALTVFVCKCKVSVYPYQNSQKIESSRSIYIADSSGGLARVDLKSISNIIGTGGGGTTSLPTPDKSIYFPYNEGFYFETNNSSKNNNRSSQNDGMEERKVNKNYNWKSYPIVHFCNLVFEGYDSTGLLIFSSTDNFEIITKPKSNYIKDEFEKLSSWITSSPHFYSLFSYTVKSLVSPSDMQPFIRKTTSYPEPSPTQPLPQLAKTITNPISSPPSSQSSQEFQENIDFNFNFMDQSSQG